MRQVYSISGTTGAAVARRAGWNRVKSASADTKGVSRVQLIWKTIDRGLWLLHDSPAGNASTLSLSSSCPGPGTIGRPTASSHRGCHDRVTGYRALGVDHGRSHVPTLPIFLINPPYRPVHCPLPGREPFGLNLVSKLSHSHRVTEHSMTVGPKVPRRDPNSTLL